MKRLGRLLCLALFCSGTADTNAQQLSISGNALSVELPTHLGTHYAIQYSRDLATWHTTGQWGHGTGASVTVEVPLEEPLFLRAMSTTHMYRTYFVSLEGSNTNSGLTPAEPFATIQKAADLMQPGDVCYLRGGVYRQTVVVPHGPEDFPEYRTFRSYPGERAVLRGDVVIPDEQWTSFEGTIWQVPWSEPITDLFIDDTMVWIARWPNASTNDPLIPEFAFMDTGTRPTLGGYSHTVTDAGLSAAPASLNGAKVWFTGKERWWARAGLVADHNSQTSFTLQIPPEAPGNDLWSGVLPAVTAPYFLYDHPDLLDAPGEWYYDPIGEMLYLWTPDGTRPQGVTVYRNRWIFDVSGCNGVRLMDMEFFSGSINAFAAQNCILEHLKLRHLDPMPFVTAPRVRERNFSLTYDAALTGVPVSGRNNTVQFCEISHSWGDGLCIDGSGHLIQYNDFHDLNYYGTMTGVSTYGSHHMLRGNAIRRMGRSGIRNDMHAGGVFEFNHISDVGKINWDLGGIYMYFALGTPTDRLLIRYNRIHDVQLTNNDGPTNYQYAGSAIYIDGGSSAVNVYRNVCYAYRRFGVQLNGDSFRQRDNADCDVAYNTLLDAPFDGLSSPTGGVYYREFGKTNVQFRYNVYWGAQTLALAGVTPVGNTGLLIGQFADYFTGDFRLTPDAPAIDAGGIIPGVTNGYLGSAPDTGAYEFGAAEWQAGIPPPSPSWPAVGPLVSVP